MGRRSSAETPARVLAAFVGRGEWDQPALAEHLGVKVRSLRVAMGVLAAAGIPVERIEHSGREVAWRVGPVTIGDHLRPAQRADGDVARTRLADHAQDAKRAAAKALRRAGLTYDAIGAALGVSRQTAWDWVQSQH
jgi:biotin operon repressor